MWYTQSAIRRDMIARTKVYETLQTKSLNNARTQTLPQMQKVIVHMRITNVKHKDTVTPLYFGLLALLSGQMATIIRSKQSNSQYKIRKDDILGGTVTLRGEIMRVFVEKFINIYCPRLGVLESTFERKKQSSLTVTKLSDSVVASNVKGKANDYTIHVHLNAQKGVHFLFPEIEHLYELSTLLFDLDLFFVVRASSREEAMLFLSSLQFPYYVSSTVL